MPVTPWSAYTRLVPELLDTLSLDEVRPDDGDDGYRQFDRIADQRATPDRVALRREALHLLDRLPERERYVMRARFLDGLTLAEIGRPLGISGERIRQLEEECLVALRAWAGGDRRSWEAMHDAWNRRLAGL